MNLAVSISVKMRELWFAALFWLPGFLKNFPVPVECQRVAFSPRTWRVDRITKIFGSDSKSLWNVTLAPGIHLSISPLTRMDKAGGRSPSLLDHEVWHWLLEAIDDSEGAAREDCLADRVPGAANDRTAVSERYLVLRGDLTWQNF